MVLSSLLLFVGLHSQDSPRLQTVLENGVSVLAENMPGAKTISVQLIAAARGLDETSATHGRRHLLEHLLVKGADRKLDLRLELLGMVLSAQTMRDGTQISIDCPKERMHQALVTLSDFMRPQRFTSEEILKETRIIGEEIALEPDSRILSKAAWQAAFGDDGLDPDGDPAELAKTTAEELSALHKAQFAAPNLAVVISGPLDLDEATRQATEVFSGFAKSARAPWKLRVAAQPRMADGGIAAGEAIAAIVPSLTEPRTSWTLAAALALAAEIKEPFVTYTPTIRNGLILLGTEADEKGLQAKVSSLSGREKARLFAIGKRLALRWVAAKLESPSSSALWRGYLLAQASGATPDSMTENLNEMTTVQFMQGLAMFEEGKAVVVRGAGSPAQAAEFYDRAFRMTPDSMVASRQRERLACLEIPETGANEIAVEAVVKLPGLSASGFAAAQVLARAIPLGNSFFSEAQIKSYCGQTGRPPTVSVMADHLRISLSFPSNQLDIAVSMLAAMLTQGSFSEDAIAEAKRAMVAPKTIWGRALWPTPTPVDEVKREQVEGLYRSTFRPENVCVVFAGAVSAGAARSAWEKRMEAWQPSKFPLAQDMTIMPPMWPAHRRGIQTIELACPEFPSWDAAFSTRYLTICALGGGKGSSIYRVLRENLGWSYRQEAFLWPTAGGFQPRIVMASTQTAGVDAKAMRAALIDDVKTWSEEYLARALSIAGATLGTKLVSNPLFITPTGPAENDLSGRAFASAYMRLKFEVPFDTAALTERMHLVRLQDLKDMALEMLEKSLARTIPAAKAN